MNKFYKATFTLLTAAVVFSLSCKKETTVAKKQEPDMASVSKQLAFDMYKSFLSGVSTQNNGGLKPGSVRGPVTMDTDHPCGFAVPGSTSKTIISGDTTRTIIGKSLFTYLCEGYYHNGNNIDSYSLKDTTTTTETGPGFSNKYRVGLDYVVKAANKFYSQLSISGHTGTFARTSKVSDGITTEYHSLNTEYNWQDVLAFATNETDPYYVSGKVYFTTNLIDKTADMKAERLITYGGYMEFLDDYKVQATFYNGPSYLINLKTGEVTKL